MTVTAPTADTGVQTPRQRIGPALPRARGPLSAGVSGGDDVAAEIAALRSVHHLEEADLRAWVVPRLDGPAEAALVPVEHDECGAGRAERLHARLFGDAMLELGLSDVHGTPLDHTLAPLVVADPSTAADVVFGTRAATFLDGLAGAHVLAAWSAEGSAFVRPLGTAA